MEMSAKMFHFTNKSKAFTLLEVMVSLFIFSIVLAVVFLSMNTSFKMLNSSLQLKDKIDDSSHISSFIKYEIKNSTSITTDGSQFTNFKNSLGFLLIKDEDEKSHEYIYFVKSDGKLIRYAKKSKYNYDEIKNYNIKLNMKKNVVDDKSSDIIAYHDVNNIYLEENGKKYVVYIGDKLK